MPEGVEVQLTGTAVFGGKNAKVQPSLPGAPVLHVDCVAVFGGVDVKSRRPVQDLFDAVRERLAPSKPSAPRLPPPPPPP